MKAVRIDFSGRPPTPSHWALLLLAIGAGLCIAAVWRHGVLSVTEERVAGDLRKAQAVLTARQPPPPPPFSLPENRINAINEAIVRLNLPWQELFRALEQTRPKNIALLGLEPDGKRRLLRVSAETKLPEDMLDFVRLLREQPQFADATLVKHETNQQDPNRPLRFMVEVHWKESL